MPNAVANYSSSFNRISLTHKYIKEHSSNAILTRMQARSPPFGPRECSVITSLSFIRSSMFTAHSYLYNFVKGNFISTHYNQNNKNTIIPHM